MKELSGKFNILWEATKKLLEHAKSEEVCHTEDMIKAVLECRQILKYDLDIFLPLAILHNIERITVLKEYFDDVVINAKLKDGKIVRLSPAENVIKNLLESIGEKQANIEEIIKIFKVREKVRKAEKEGVGEIKKFFDTDNKKLFYDLHLLSRFNRKEVKAVKKAISDKDRFEKLMADRFNLFFNDKLRNIAEKKLREIEGINENFVWGEH